MRLLSWTSGSSDSGTSEQPAQLLVPALRVDIVQHRPAGVGDVGRVHRAAGQPPQQEAVDRAKRQLAALRPGPGARHMIEQPRDLGARRNRGRAEARSCPDQRLDAIRLEPRAKFGGAPVLPDDRAVDRLAGRAVPHDGRFALVGDADRGDRDRSRRRSLAIASRAVASVSARCPPDRARPSRAAGNAGPVPAGRSATGRAAASNRIARVDVVPWSIARMWSGRIAVASSARRAARRARTSRRNSRARTSAGGRRRRPARGRCGSSIRRTARLPPSGSPGADRRWACDRRRRGSPPRRRGRHWRSRSPGTLTGCRARRSGNGPSGRKLLLRHRVGRHRHAHPAAASAAVRPIVE